MALSGARLMCVFLIGMNQHFFFNFIYFLGRQREHKQGEWQAEGEGGSPLSKEPDAGLDPRTLADT